MTKKLDASGLACPAPVLMVREAIEKEKLDALEVILDNEAARENVSRFLSSQNFAVSASMYEDNHKICAHRKEEGRQQTFAQETFVKPTGSQKRRIMILISTDRMGSGDDELGKKLMVNFIKTIKEMGGDIWRLVFVNNGVKLSVKGSPTFEDLINYEKDDIDILVCGTCLEHFDLLKARKVGETTNMLDIVTSMQLADKVITI